MIVFLTLWCDFDVSGKQSKISDIEIRASNPSFWDDSKLAQYIMMELSDLKQVVQVWTGLADKSNNLRQLVQLALDEEDNSLVDSLTSDISDIDQELSDREFD